MSYCFYIILALPLLLYYSSNIVRFLVSLLIHYRKNSEKSSLKYQVNEFRKELSHINQIDEFAKFSKLQRKLRSSTDRLDSINREDLELKFKYFLVGQALVWGLAVTLVCIYFGSSFFTGVK